MFWFLACNNISRLLLPLLLCPPNFKSRLQNSPCWEKGIKFSFCICSNTPSLRIHRITSYIPHFKTFTDSGQHQEIHHPYHPFPTYMFMSTPPHAPQATSENSLCPQTHHTSMLFSLLEILFIPCMVKLFILKSSFRV